MRRRFDQLVKSFSLELERKMGGGQSSSGSGSTHRRMSGVARMFSQKSFGNNKASTQPMDQESARLTRNGNGSVAVDIVDRLH